MPGRLLVGTSGFSYPAWIPRFYPPGTRSDAFLDHYARRLPACELNGTWYRAPSPEQVAAWASAVPPAFRFVVKAVRGSGGRLLGPRAGDPGVTLERLLAPLGGFGPRLGAILLRVETGTPFDEGRFAALLERWPAGIGLALDLEAPAWSEPSVADRIESLASGAGAAIVRVERDETSVDPGLDAGTSAFAYLRLRRSSYDEARLATWAARLAPLVAAGRDVFAFFRHDEDGSSALHAERLAVLVQELEGTS